MRSRRLLITSFILVALVGAELVLPAAALSPLRDYDRAERVARRYLQVLSIRDQESYLAAKKRLSRLVSPEIQRSLFGEDRYTGTAVYPPRVTVLHCRGSIDGGKQFTFKMDLRIEYVGANRNQMVTILVTIVDGVVTQTMRV
ncbi:MAG: hypothetical protein ACM3ZQ_11755 [Bacillota bacterium]